MKTRKLIILLVFTMLGTVAINGCEDLDVTNTNNPTRKSVLENPSNTLKLLKGGYQDVFGAAVGHWSMHIHMMADQHTSTNAFEHYWAFADEPRRRLNNTQAYSASQIFTSHWGAFNSGVGTANQFIDIIENQGQTYQVGGNDITNKVKAEAYFLRGLSRGYLGLMFDQGYLLEAGNDEEDAEFKSYGKLIEGAKSDIDKAISIADGASFFKFNDLPNSSDSYNLAEFKDIANSFAARILAGQARNRQERDNLDWQQIQKYAKKGIGGPNAKAKSSLTDFTLKNVGSNGIFANNLADVLNLIVACGDPDVLNTCAGYNPVDVKQIHMLDPSYPTIYPPGKAASAAATLSPASSNDPRLERYVYTQNPGFLDNTRNPKLFSNYWNMRTFANSNWWPSSFGVTLFTSTENDLLRAEAALMQNDKSTAAEVLNNSSAGSEPTEFSIELPAKQLGFITGNAVSGGHNYNGSESVARFQWALLREYSVEIGPFGGVGVQWFFMRRHDMLQKGTATMLPVPGQELTLTGREGYTFGGPSYAGEAGTASGDNSWKDLAPKAFPNMNFKKSSSTSEKLYRPTIKSDIKVSNSNKTTINN